MGAATVVAVAIGSPAWANSTININPGNLGKTAVEFPSHECDPNQGGGPLAGQDIWIFNLPDQGQTDLGDFVSVTATFGANGPITITTALNPGNFNTSLGTSRAWIITPLGWTLTAATAEITDPSNVATDQTFFVLTHTCPGTGTPAPTTPPVEETTPPVDQSTPPRTDPGTPSGGVNSGGGGSQSGGGLFFGLTALAVAAAGGGVLFLAWRRRNSA